MPNFYGREPSGMLPPRAARKDDGWNDTSGYPAGQFTFTGSPICEHEQPNCHMEHESTNVASGGSLRKVRRFNATDDVVAASGVHLRRRRQPPPKLSIETNYKMGDINDDDVSPTDVLSFPMPPQTPARAPPTPVKVRPNRNKAAGRFQPNTPHPGGEDGTDNQQPKSRFYSDFDVIGELGKGSFGTVYKVLSSLDGCMYAIKAAQRKAKGPSDRDRMLKEVSLLLRLFACCCYSL
jgi:hypothetical protein